MSACTIYILLAAMSGALLLLMLLIVTTCVMVAFSNAPTEHVNTRVLRGCIYTDDNGYAGETPQLPTVTGTPLRGPESVRSTARGDGGGAGSRGVYPSQIERGRTFTRLRGEQGPHQSGAQG